MLPERYHYGQRETVLSLARYESHIHSGDRREVRLSQPHGEEWTSFTRMRSEYREDKSNTCPLQGEKVDSADYMLLSNNRFFKI